MRIEQFVLEGLGHLSTLIADDDAGVAAVIDPRRDVDVYLAAARARDLRIELVVETHLHNDYVSGARELAHLTGATHVIGAGADLRFEHRRVADGEAFDLGALRFTTLATPGHTPEHVAYAIADRTRADEPVLLMTGGSLLVGAVGRTDLLGEAEAVPYAHAMHRTIHEVILPHEDFVTVYPTHGAGSLCSTGIGSTPWTTIGFERRHNPLVQPMDVDAFARALLRGQPAFPRYFARMRPTNQAGPRLLGEVVPAALPLPVAETQAALAQGAVLVDARNPAGFALGHVPGSISIPTGSSFGTWLGWVVEPDRPVVLIVDDPADLDDLVRQALRVGYETIVGHLQGGFARWVEAGGPIESTGRLDVAELARTVAAGDDRQPLVIDVQQASEYEEAHVPGALHLNAGSVPDRLSQLPAGRPIAVMCASGYRSSVAASLLRAGGFEDVSWVADGLSAWQAAGYPVERGAGTD
ncbi:MAG: rhodanese-like domain-containing protein [Chloroflexota bacterium]